MSNEGSSCHYLVEYLCNGVWVMVADACDEAQAETRVTAVEAELPCRVWKVVTTRTLHQLHRNKVQQLDE